MRRKPPYTPPPPEVVAEAKRQMREDMRGLDELCDAFRAEFAARSPLDFFTIMPQTHVPFYVLISFKREEDVAASEASGLAEEMRAFVRRKLAEVGREGEPAFDFNSRERIGRSYFLYLR